MLSVPHKFYSLNREVIPQVLYSWPNHNHSLWYLRMACKSWRMENDVEIKRKCFKDRFTKLRRDHLSYIENCQSKAEIAVILWMSERADRHGSCRFKILDLSDLCGISRQKLSKAIDSLIKKGMIERRDKLHPNFVIAHGFKYSFIN